MPLWGAPKALPTDLQLWLLCTLAHLTVGARTEEGGKGRDFWPECGGGTRGWTYKVEECVPVEHVLGPENPKGLESQLQQ